MRDRDRNLWYIGGTGRFLSHSEEFENGLPSFSLGRLDALIYAEGKEDGESADNNVPDKDLSFILTRDGWSSNGTGRMSDSSEDTIEVFVKGLLDEVCDSVAVVRRARRLSVDERNARKSHRNTSVTECRNNLVNLNGRPAALDENSNSSLPKEKVKEKKKKKISFNSIFGKKDRVKPKDNREEEETHDNLSQLPVIPVLNKSRKYASALELHQPARRKSSFIRKLVHIGEDSSNFLRRSLSFREGKKHPRKDSKEQEWRQSLQSLVETDISVSYNDLSFVDYDPLNDLQYDDVSLKPGRVESPAGGYIGRTQSMIEKRSPEVRRPFFQRLSVNERDRSSVSSLPTSSAVSLPSLHHLNQENGETNCESTSSVYKYRRRPQSVNSDDGAGVGSVGSFRSGAGSGCAKLKRHNARRQKVRDPHLLIEPRHHVEEGAVRKRVATLSDARRCARILKDLTLFNIVNIFSSSKSPKIVREASVNIERQQQEQEQQQEWRRFVGSIRRKVQRHGSGNVQQPPQDGRDHHPARSSSSPQPEEPALPRKGSLRRERSCERRSASQEEATRPLVKQKSIESSSSRGGDLFKALSFRDKSKSVSVRQVDATAAAAATTTKPHGERSQKGVRKSDKKDSDKYVKPSISFSRSRSGAAQKSKEGLKQDDFLKATMRIFLVVSPPAGKIQVRSRSLNHLDTLEMRQGAVSSADSALKDSKSEPDCTRPQLTPTVPSTPTNAVPPARKHMLSRSQKSSSECFSVNFEVGDENTWDNELFFPALRGLSLHESLAKLCELRNIDLSSCDARLQDKENNVESLILFSQDTANLVGKHVRITAKDTSNKKLSGSFYSNHSRKQSGSYRPRTTSFFNSSTEDANVVNSTLSLHDSDQNKKQIKQRLTAFFGNTKDTKYEALIDQLDKYSKQGIPHILKYPQGQCESIDALYKLEDDWRDIIDYSDLNEKQQQQQTALWELIKTEIAYIRTLKVVTDLFLACLKDLQSRNLLKEIDTDKLFSNITDILDANVVFWRNTLFPLVRDMRRYRRTACLENMLEGFHNVRDVFQPYYKYCAEQSRCQHYCRENLESEVFTAYLTWCESQKECNRLRLMDILVQPMQRLTKYGLLLKAILKNTDEDVERENLQTIIRIVDEFVNKVNSSLKDRQDNERLKGVIARIESYDIVESKDDDIEKILKKEKSLAQLDLTRPMLNCPMERKRRLLLEGDLKMKDSGTSKMDVHCFLLTDMLLVCKPATKKGGAGAIQRVVRQPYLVDRLLVTELHRETPSLAIIYKNEFDMAIAAFILQSNDAKKLKAWKESIAKAQMLYAQAKQVGYMADESLDTEYSFDYNLESDYSNLQLAPKSPLATSSRASRVSSLAHSHSGSVEMNDQSSIGSANNQSRAVSVENENRTGSLSSDEGVQPIPADSKSPVSQKNSFKNRLFNKTPNTLSVQPYGSLGQSLPNLTLGSPNLTLSLNQNTLSVPSGKNGGHLLSPTHRGISYPPPSPTRGNLKRSLAISQTKNPPLIKTRQVNSASSVVGQQVPTSFDFDVPVIAGTSQQEDYCESFSRGQHRQAMKRSYRYHTAGIVDDIKKNDSRDNSIHKRLSWNCSSSQEPKPPNEDHQT